MKIKNLISGLVYNGVNTSKLAGWFNIIDGDRALVAAVDDPGIQVLRLGPYGGGRSGYRRRLKGL